VYKTAIKRILDFFIALVLFILSSPIFLFIYILLFFANSGKAFFIQERPGLKMIPFKLYKFKTMNDEMSEDGNLLPDGDRLTTTGRIIRKLSLDELPQLINVLKGDMSLIGPRPWLMEYLPIMNDYQKRRHDVRPGISGWAQVNGRNLTDWDRRFELDNFYVDNISFALDLKIFFMTMWNILTAKGISGDGTETMKKFKGNG